MATFRSNKIHKVDQIWLHTPHGGQDVTQFTALSDPDEHGKSDYAKVTLREGRAYPNFYYSDTQGTYEDVGGGNSSTLFTISEPVIDHAWSSKGMRAHVPTLLALAANRARGGMNVHTDEPLNVKADWMLSPHSAHLVQRAYDAGVMIPPKGKPVAEVRGNVEGEFLTDKTFDSAEIHGPEVPQHELADARTTVRRTIRKMRGGSSTPVSSHPAYEQLSFQFDKP